MYPNAERAKQVLIHPTFGTLGCVQLTQEPGSGGTARLVVSGEIDMSNAPQVRDAGIAAVTADDVRELTVDLSGVTFLDSTGLGALVAVRTAGSDLSRVVRITDASPRVRQVIQVCGLSAEFGLDSTDSVPATD